MTESGSVLCISDLHLSPERMDLYEAFRDFLTSTAASASALFILGDFFDVWIGDDEPGTFAADVIRELRHLSDGGTRLYIMHGNRDFLLGEAFCKACGATLVDEPYLLECFGSQYLLMHGDSLCTRDSDYMAFRDMVRNPAWQADFLARPLEERQAFARQAREKSKSMSSNKPEDIMDVTPSEVERLLQEHGQSILIHGHTHRPAVHELDLGGDSGKRIVLGDWDEKGWYLEIDPRGTSLENFAIRQ